MQAAVSFLLKWAARIDQQIFAANLDKGSPNGPILDKNKVLGTVSMR